MDLQDGSPIDISAVGVRKPRSGSVRKPRSGAQTVVTFDQEVTLSPVIGSPARTSFWNEGSDVPARDSDSMHSQIGDIPFLSHSEMVRDSGELRAHSQSSRMEGEERTELRMFQRRERKREDEKTYVKDASRSGSKSWKDSDAPERSFGREEIRRSGSPSYEVAKKAKDSTERLDRAWRERESSERRYKDVVYRERDDYVSNSSWHKSKGLQDRDKGEHSWVDRDYKERPDYSMKDRAHRERDQSYTSQKDWKSKGHPRDKDYERGDRVHDLKDSSYKSRSVNVVVEAAERHSNQQNHSGLGATHRNDRSSDTHDRESPSLHRHSASGRSSHQGEQIQTENFSRNKSAIGSSSSFHEARGSEKGAEPSNVGDSRSIPKLKLKVGGITHTLNSDGKRQPEVSDPVSRTPHQSGSLHKKRSSSAPEPNRRRQRLILQEDSDEEDDLLPSSKERAQASDEDRFLAYLAEEPAYSRGSGGVMFDNSQNLQGVRKSSRVPKKRVFDGDDDVEVEPKRKRKKKVEVDSDEELYRIEEDELDHGFAEEEEMEIANDSKLKFTKRRRKSLETDMPGIEDRKSISSVVKMGVVVDSRGGVPLTARQRALQSSKEGLADVGSNVIEFPEGLTHSAPKKQKEVLSAAERQLKKEEAAQKRRQQVEKAAKEIQAVAIQKILCQDSQRKKREGKLQKQREEMEQEKKAASMVPASNSIRWVLGPNGTVVSFSQDLELPNIFSGPLSYPQQRERCAGPSCTNAYKYRDSKTLLPLCSLQCYRAVQKKPSEAGLAH
ncbi:hypothetical protein L7F22_041609 [Adiantum nelumboides]|nr:hypothetical protein [Adiantum nelumboides]